MVFNPETLPLGGSAPARSQSSNNYLVAALSVMLLASGVLNVVQYTGQNPVLARLGDGTYDRMEDPQTEGKGALGKPTCDEGLVLKCVDEASAAPGSPIAEAEQAKDIVDDKDDNVGTVPGEAALEAADTSGKYCRKDTWLLSCLFYKADIDDELTDWKSVKAECDRAAECDGVNKYWTSDLWHISSSGSADGCDKNLKDGNGTDASAFYKEGSKGWDMYYNDGSCREVDEWGNPKEV